MAILPIITTQNVTINMEISTVGKRILSSIIDYVVKFAYLIVAYYIGAFSGLFQWFETQDQWSIVATNILIGLPFILYTLVLEIVLDGQTIGKKLTKLKVIRVDGYEASFGDYVIRWMFCVIDVLISFGIIGLISMLASNKTQRIGDIASGTCVVSLEKDWKINQTIFKDLELEYVPLYTSVMKLTDKDLHIIQSVLKSYYDTRNMEDIFKLARKLEAVMGIKREEKVAIDFVDRVMKDYNFYTKDLKN